jgi:hypothetical protein
LTTIQPYLHIKSYILLAAPLHMLMSQTHYITKVEGLLMYPTVYNWNPYW